MAGGEEGGEEGGEGGEGGKTLPCVDHVPLRGVVVKMLKAEEIKRIKQH